MKSSYIRVLKCIKNIFNSFFLIIFVHGGVLPKWVHGSNVVYKDAPEKFVVLFNALYSECGLPWNDVTPVDKTAPFFTITVPTEGFNLVLPKFFAKWKARSK